MKKKQKYGLVLVVLLGFMSWVVVSRPDISMAMSVIDNALDYSEDDFRVTLASQYLINQANPQVYSKLRLYIWNCYTVESPYDYPPYDFRAARSANILGYSSSVESENMLIDMLTRNYPQEGPYTCLSYAFRGLVLKEDGYNQVLSIANNRSLATLIRRFALRWLGVSGDAIFVEPLIIIALQDENIYARADAAQALVKLGTINAIETVQKIAQEDQSEYVREEALEALETISE